MSQKGVCILGEYPDGDGEGCDVYVTFVLPDYPIPAPLPGDLTAEGSHRLSLNNSSPLWWDQYASRQFAWATHIGKLEVPTFPLTADLFEDVSAQYKKEKEQNCASFIGGCVDFERCGGFQYCPPRGCGCPLQKFSEYSVKAYYAEELPRGRELNLRGNDAEWDKELLRMDDDTLVATVIHGAMDDDLPPPSANSCRAPVAEKNPWWADDYASSGDYGWGAGGGDAWWEKEKEDSKYALGDGYPGGRYGYWDGGPPPADKKPGREPDQNVFKCWQNCFRRCCKTEPCSELSSCEEECQFNCMPTSWRENRFARGSDVDSDNPEDIEKGYYRRFGRLGYRIPHQEDDGPYYEHRGDHIYIPHHDDEWPRGHPNNDFWDYTDYERAAAGAGRGGVSSGGVAYHKRPRHPAHRNIKSIARRYSKSISKKLKALAEIDQDLNWQLQAAHDEARHLAGESERVEQHMAMKVAEMKHKWQAFAANHVGDEPEKLPYGVGGADYVDLSDEENAGATAGEENLEAAATDANATATDSTVEAAADAAEDAEAAAEAATAETEEKVAAAETAKAEADKLKEEETQLKEETKTKLDEAKAAAEEAAANTETAVGANTTAHEALAAAEQAVADAEAQAADGEAAGGEAAGGDAAATAAPAAPAILVRTNMQMIQKKEDQGEGRRGEKVSKKLKLVLDVGKAQSADGPGSSDATRSAAEPPKSFSNSISFFMPTPLGSSGDGGATSFLQKSAEESRTLQSRPDLGENLGSYSETATGAKGERPVLGINATHKASGKRINTVYDLPDTFNYENPRPELSVMMPTTTEAPPPGEGTDMKRHMPRYFGMTPPEWGKKKLHRLATKWRQFLRRHPMQEAKKTMDAVWKVAPGTENNLCWSYMCGSFWLLSRKMAESVTEEGGAWSSIEGGHDAVTAGAAIAGHVYKTGDCLQVMPQDWKKPWITAEIR
eukprot:g9859.t1